MEPNTNTPPLEFGGLPLVIHTFIDGRHRHTGYCRHVGPAGEINPAAGLAVCGRPGEGFFLFRCDADWRVVADDWHATAEEARRQAEFEYEGVAATWQHRQ